MDGHQTSPTYQSHVDYGLVIAGGGVVAIAGLDGGAATGLGVHDHYFHRGMVVPRVRGRTSLFNPENSKMQNRLKLNHTSTRNAVQ
ncbi:hypothetical protein L1987_13816 [Smallanthus sonchifolius]|uniref:Uncharacterized protein n=1 Tax=Smallanthus sonchifolius TaxID=185202 RepID=A0ACB9JIK7_9ASTR|nr:hypothetical protein L1987_13816 [Smallanthus sonchifolius]